MSSTAIGTFTCWDGYDGYELVEEQPPPRPPRRSRLASTSNIPAPRRRAERSGERPQASKPTTGQPPREHEYTTLEELWNTLREKKQAAEAKLPLKVKSLEKPQPGPTGSAMSRFTPGPLAEQHITHRKPTPPKVKRKKSTYATALLQSLRRPDPSQRVAGIAFHFASPLQVAQCVYFVPHSRDDPSLSPHRSPRPLICPR